jgi:hypothetical protein
MRKLADRPSTKRVHASRADWFQAGEPRFGKPIVKDRNGSDQFDQAHVENRWEGAYIVSNQTQRAQGFAARPETDSKAYREATESQSLLSTR